MLGVPPRKARIESERRASLGSFQGERAHREIFEGHLLFGSRLGLLSFNEVPLRFGHLNVEVWVREVLGLL